MMKPCRHDCAYFLVLFVLHVSALDKQELLTCLQEPDNHSCISSELCRLSLWISPEIRDKLSVLAEKPTVSVGIVSGRSLSDTRAMVGLDSIYYAGNHGLEIEGPGISYISQQAEAARITIRERYSTR